MCYISTQECMRIIQLLKFSTSHHIRILSCPIIESYHIKKNLHNNLPSSILYRAINNKPCFLSTLLKKQHHWHTFALTHVDCHSMTERHGSRNQLTITLKRSFNDTVQLNLNLTVHVCHNYTTRHIFNIARVSACVCMKDR